jgi:arginyl-tRNA--protein-N-Asp/Glu arginylyltransferase
MISNIWEDMCHVSWWRSKRYLMRVVCNAMRANVIAFRCADGFFASQAIKIFSEKG